jgi:hypothetical protein
MKLGIAIRGYHSPNLLNLTLESIFKADKIANTIVGIYLEKSISDTVRQELFTIIGNYPIDKVLISGFYSNNTFDNTYPLGDMFNKEDCNIVMLLDEGIIIKSETLLYIDSLNMSATIYGLHLSDVNKANSWSQDFDSAGFVISKPSFDYFKRWVDAKLYLSHVWYPSEEDSNRKRLWELDLIPIQSLFETLMKVFLVTQGGVCKYPDISYTTITNR